MNGRTIEVFHALLKKGWIDRRENQTIWSYWDDAEVQEELDQFKAVMGIDLYRVGDRLYMIPTQDNDLFLKDNVDYRGDIKAENSVKMPDIYLLNYLAVFTIFLFFGGEGSDPLIRDFLVKEELIHLFTEHCKKAEQTSLDEASDADFGENFKLLANDWLSKIEGTHIARTMDSKYGVVNKLMNKFKADDLFDCDDTDRIIPTRKMKDLMPYFLRKDRIMEINAFLKGGESDAAD